MKNYDETIQSVFQRIDEYKTVKKQKRKMIKRTVTSLCCICLVVVACFGVWKSGMLSGTSPKQDKSSGMQGGQSVGKIAKKDAGDLYVVAKDYGQVYDVLEEMYDYGYVRDDAVDVDEEDAGASEYTTAADATESNYSKTNLQTAGVDESDIIKTDGTYIYTVNGSIVYITDVRNGRMQAAGEIVVEMNSASDRIIEMYVDQNTVNLIVSKQETDLKKRTIGEAETAVTDYVEDCYYLDTNQITELLTYDISNPQNPFLKGCVTQEGTYQTSRKIEDVVYLFTNKYMSRSQMTREEAADEEGIYDWIPLVNGETIAADCIYIPEKGSLGLVVSSVNIQEPEEIVDNVMIINDYVEIYVSTTAIYLYGQNYGTSITTEIAKFSMEQGIINAVDAVNVPGEVRDTFAINEYQGKLRLLTTDWSHEESENNLYLFDENLKLTGKLEGLALGEQIYSARFLQNMAYFVTYRNMDPLFAVDLSDETNPKVLSELKITGFSEYLHFWGEDKLVGIGYETDPETGSQKGLKITMFDISDPADLKTAGSCVLENIYYSPALYNYKCVLVDEEENLIGFGVETIYGYDYLLFAWEDGNFKELMSENLEDGNLNQYRGIYIDDMFYLAYPEGITSYDRTDGYKMVQELKF